MNNKSAFAEWINGGNWIEVDCAGGISFATHNEWSPHEIPKIVGMGLLY